MAGDPGGQFFVTEGFGVNDLATRQNGYKQRCLEHFSVLCVEEGDLGASPVHLK